MKTPLQRHGAIIKQKMDSISIKITAIKSYITSCRRTSRDALAFSVCSIFLIFSSIPRLTVRSSNQYCKNKIRRTRLILKNKTKRKSKLVITSSKKTKKDELQSKQIKLELQRKYRKHFHCKDWSDVLLQNNRVSLKMAGRHHSKEKKKYLRECLAK